LTNGLFVFICAENGVKRSFLSVVQFNSVGCDEILKKIVIK